jgi:hypothetical protein
MLIEVPQCQGLNLFAWLVHDPKGHVFFNEQRPFYLHHNFRLKKSLQAGDFPCVHSLNILAMCAMLRKQHLLIKDLSCRC